jgi:hypothetical protein
MCYRVAASQSLRGSADRDIAFRGPYATHLGSSRHSGSTSSNGRYHVIGPLAYSCNIYLARLSHRN